MGLKRWSNSLAIVLVGTMLAACMPGPGTGPRPGLIQPPPAPLTRLDHGLMAQRGPIPFPIEANVGQAAGQVAYLVRMGDLQVGFEAGGLSYALRATEPAETAEPGSRGRPGLERPDQVHHWTVRQELVGAGHAEPVGTITAETAISYFVGPSDAGRVGVPAYHQVAYPGVWSGITAAYQRVGFGLKSSFHLAPGADPAQIRLAYHGGHTRLAEDGALEVETPLGLMRESAPVAWQEGRAGRKPVTVRWVLRDGPDGDAEEVGFQTGAYDPSRPLVIDPSLTYTTYVGGSGTDIGNSIAVDAGGSTYVTGRTLSSQATFPTGGGFVGTPGFDQTFNSNYDAFVVKLNPSGTGLVYATYLGGVNQDIGYGITVDATGNAYVTGSTQSSAISFLGGGFLGVPGFDKTLNSGQDAFVVKLNPSGTGLVYATYLGGSSGEDGIGIAVDAGGSAYVTGYTTSTQTTFPDDDPNGNDLMDVPGFDQTHNGNLDAFVVKLNPSGTALVYATYVGGSSQDVVYSITVDAGGSAYITGQTQSTQATFPGGGGFLGVPGFDQTQNGGGADAFVVKLNAAGTGLVYATFLGGASGEAGNGIAVDASGSAYVTGYTTSTQATFPDGDVNGNDLMDVPGFDQTHNGDVDAFVVKLNPSGTALVYATYVGGSDLDVGNAIAITAGGNAYVTGYTRSSEATFPDGDPNGNDLMDVPGFDQNHNGGAGLDDLFVAKLTESTSTPTQTPTNTSTLTSTPTSTTSPTSTSTPTSTPTATPGLCAPRPKVNVTMSPGGAGLLNATLQAQVLPATPVNALTSLRVTALTNVQVSRNGVILAAGPIIPLPPGTQQIVLVVQRLVPGQAATAQLVVTDACGEWPTFVGGGPNAF
ncbi:MAG TPA: SBBP repeat-containing protein [Chloroflexota bacterium]|nr:SBBP repeat-containing protein [Chloroflexota bacterium]